MSWGRLVDFCGEDSHPAGHETWRFPSWTMDLVRSFALFEKPLWPFTRVLETSIQREKVLLSSPWSLSVHCLCSHSLQLPKRRDKIYPLIKSIIGSGEKYWVWPLGSSNGKIAVTGACFGCQSCPWWSEMASGIGSYTGFMKPWCMGNMRVISHYPRHHHIWEECLHGINLYGPTRKCLGIAS